MADSNLPAIPDKTPLYTVARGLFNVIFRTVYPTTWHNTERVENLAPPYIIMGNHQSFADPLVIAVAVKGHEISFMGKRELANKWTDKLMRTLHMIPVTRGATDMSAMRASMQVVKNGGILGIFPEGTRHQEKMMQEVESGAALIALRAKVPLMPVYIDRHIMPFRRTHVYFGEPINIDDLLAQGMNTDTVNALCDRIRDTFYAMRDQAK